jgi:deazaflavin-dependent oxidoreductase (nitroreductase family)
MQLDVCSKHDMDGCGMVSMHKPPCLSRGFVLCQKFDKGLGLKIWYMPEKKSNRIEQFALRVEETLMTRLLPQEDPGPVFKWLFKVPVIFYRLGLPLFGNFILLLTTRGRKSGKLRHTPLEYRREEGTGYRIIMTGWGGNTDWRFNIKADPHVTAQAGREKYDALAEPLTDAEVAVFLAQAMRLNPASGKIWSRWAGEPVTLADPEGILKAARHFPSFRLIPLGNKVSYW